jgi:[acyl-carrier-protein] S-malonyltransferase
MQKLISEGVDLFIEVGPGKVISGLMKQIDRNARCLSADDPDSLDRVLAAIQ